MDPSTIDKANQWSSLGSSLLAIGAVVILPARWVWNFGRGIDARVKLLEEESKASSLSFIEIKIQSDKILEKLNAEDEGTKLTLQTIARIDERTKDSSNRLERIETKCLGTKCDN